MYRLLLTTLFVVFLRLLTLAEAAADPHFPSEPDRTDFAANFDSPTGADAAACVRGQFEADYFDFTAKALRPLTGFLLVEELGEPLRPDRSDSLPQAHPSSGSGSPPAVPPQAGHPAAPTWPGILPPQLHHPPYDATAPPLPR